MKTICCIRGCVGAVKCRKRCSRHYRMNLNTRKKGRPRKTAPKASTQKQCRICYINPRMCVFNCGHRTCQTCARHRVPRAATHRNG